MALMLAGRYLQERALGRSREHLLVNDGSDHLRTRRLRDNEVETVKIDEVGVGDVLLLAPGDLVPVDAELVEGDGLFSLDWISGESEPREFAAGERIPAGSFCAGRAPLRARAVRDSGASGLVDLLRTPADDREHGSGLFWARVNRVYVILVLFLALLGAGAWALWDPSRSFLVATSILVVTCPCALGLATPLAFHLVLARLRREGIFVRRRSLLDRARQVRKVLFDKTGTLTWGGLRTRTLQCPEGEARDALLTLAGSSSHPVSQALLRDLEGRGFRFRGDLWVREVPGGGVEGRTRDAVYRLGSPAFVGDDREEDDRSCVFGRDGRVEGRFRLEEDYRSGVAEEVAALRRDRISVSLISGDRGDRVQAAGARLGIPADQVYGGLSPEGKAQLVRRLDDEDTLMVGDGLNDAAAFAAAWCAGTPAMDRPVMPARSDFCFVGARAGAVRLLLQESRRLHRVVRTNLWMAGVYNTGALVLCLAGVMTPLVCAVLMPLSSVALIGHTSLRLAGSEVRG